MLKLDFQEYSVLLTTIKSRKQKQKMNYFALETECFILLKGVLNVFRYQRMSKEVRNRVYLNGLIGNNLSDHQIMNGY